MNFEEFISSGLANLSLYEDMYAAYQKDPAQVPSAWRDFFSSLKEPLQRKEPPAPKMAVPTSSVMTVQEHPESRIQNLINAYRTHGHLLAVLNPIALQKNEEPEELKLSSLGFQPQELQLPFPTCGVMKQKTATLQEIIQTLRSIYCGSIGMEYMGFHSPEFERWMQEQIEPNGTQSHLTIEQKQMILQHLNKSELFESFLHTKYVGQKRFSLEGAETLIPMMAAVVETGAESGVEEFVIGMAHRGRINVLCNIMNKSYADVFAEFEENYIPNSFEGSGDVKYHKGFASEVLTLHGHRVQIFMTANPSHLESVCPVVEGQVRARQMNKEEESRLSQAIPVLIHGDAGISGQGVVYETMQLAKLPGYKTGGTIHFVVNNQIGFTTIPEDARSTRYCTDIAKTFDMPVFHVNAEDPEACVFVTNLAIAIRQKFHSDVLIDLNCYRKYGHNESDEPAFTQPLEYQLIRQKKPIREIYRDQLIQQGVLEKYMAEELESEFKKALQQALKGSKITYEEKKVQPSTSQPVNLFQPVETGVPLRTLQILAERACAIPRDFNAHPKVEHLLRDRLAMVEATGSATKPVDWGMAETLAYASLLWEGIPIRLTGQDTCRGTFSHRHAMWVDQKNERRYYPLAHLKKDQGRFEIYNSPLSEFAALGFEYGYSLADPRSLVIWEAQFGDFSNGAQIILDQYLAPSQQKWGKAVSLALLLPHGYEGQGPEHSSARMERFLALAGNQNMFIVNPTTPAQFFHLLRRHKLKPLTNPLIVFTPKGLLRHPECVNPVQDLTHGAFQEILDDPRPPASPKRLIFCCGRVFYDLMAERQKIKATDAVIIRIEQLYPLHSEKIAALIAKYSTVQDYLWVQEEPQNMGAWDFIHDLINPLLPQGKRIRYIGRERSASPAVGAYALHKKEHAAMMNAVFPPQKEPFLDVGFLHRV